MPHKPLTLLELNGLVRDAIELSLPDEYWVEAELSDINEHGHCYMELIQKDEFSNTPVAKARATCWRNVWQKVRSVFEKTTGQTLHSGMKVLLEVKPTFHEAYGFAYNVLDIDPTFTLGDMVRKRQEIIQKLKEEGVFDMQKELEIPLFAQHIAVISSATAAGYGDFCNQLAGNEYGLVFQTTLFPAIMQGEQVEPTVIAALNEIASQADDYDVVVIIRGGGATADMSGFDTLSLAENVANFPLPIITGIGHERDECVLDMVSNTRVKTPTAAAAFLIDHLAEVLTLITDVENTIISTVSRRMELERMRLARLAEKVPTLFKYYKSRQESRLDSLSLVINTAIGRKLERGKSQITALETALSTHAVHLLDSRRQQFRLLEEKTRLMNPQLMLQRGYSITLFNGRSVKDASSLKAGDEIETRLAKGTFKSIVK